jgi:competence protein ComEC
MQGQVPSHHTRFRAYKMECPGSSFSYFVDGHFTLVEGMAPECNRQSILEELKLCGVKSIDVLHITSWDNDHCHVEGLEWILEHLKPRRIETPGYVGTSKCAISCTKIVQEYRDQRAKAQVTVTVQAIDPPYVNGLSSTSDWAYKDVVYHPKQLFDRDNDNSTVKLFRSGSFNVLSLGDVQDSGIAALLAASKTVKQEVDVLILAHHGADNGFTTKKFLKAVKPQVAIATCNFDNQHDHPRDAIREMLDEENIPSFTTKTGDILIESIGGHTRDFLLRNIHHEEVTTRLPLKAKKFDFLKMNPDSQRNRLHPGFKGLR